MLLCDLQALWPVACLAASLGTNNYSFVSDCVRAATGKLSVLFVRAKMTHIMRGEFHRLRARGAHGHNNNQDHLK